MKQKGFTLIELLAVIVILAIIAIIAVPVILNVIEKSKIGAAEQSAIGYIDAVEKQIVTNKVKNENLIEEGEYTKSQLDEKNVKIKGEITDAILVVGAKGRVTQGRFCINGYSIDYDGKKATKTTEANYCGEINSIVDTCPYEINQIFNFDYTGDIQEFTPECSGKYKLEAWGGSGGYISGYENKAGHGAYSVSFVSFESNVSLKILVGGQGVKGSTQTYSSGSQPGGGGTFIASADNTPYCVAGGGGGKDTISSSGTYTDSSYLYSNGQNTRLGGTGYSGSIGSEGYGGPTNAAGRNYGAGGGGFYGNGTDGNHSNAGGVAFVNGGTSIVGTDGCKSGFGGGGMSYSRGATTAGGGGAGGGYTGGTGGQNNNDGYGGGGGSYWIGENSFSKGGWEVFTSPSGTNETGHLGNGYARITYLGK